MSRIIKAESIEAAIESGAFRRGLPQRRRTSRAAASVVDAATIVQSARARAMAILEGAQTAAARLLEDAEIQAASVREQAREEGYREGYAQGVAEGREVAEQDGAHRWNEALASVQEAVRELGALRAEALASAETDMVKFAVLIAEKILRVELADPERTLAIARSLLAEVRDESRVTLYLPAELQLADGEIRELVDTQASAGMQLIVKYDSGLALGDVRIETAWGWIDGRASVRWERLVEALRRGIDDDDGDD